MTVKEKALGIVIEMQFQKEPLMFEQAKVCALIAIENEYNAKIQLYCELEEFFPDIASQAAIYCEREKEKVKQEIKKL